MEISDWFPISVNNLEAWTCKTISASVGRNLSPQCKNNVNYTFIALLNLWHQYKQNIQTTDYMLSNYFIQSGQLPTYALYNTDVNILILIYCLSVRKMTQYSVNKKKQRQLDQTKKDKITTRHYSHKSIVHYLIKLTQLMPYFIVQIVAIYVL